MNSVKSKLELEGQVARMGMVPGLIYFAETSTGRVFSTRLGHFSGYRGQPIDEFGLRPGTRIRFRINPDQETVAAASIVK